MQFVFDVSPSLPLPALPLIPSSPPSPCFSERLLASLVLGYVYSRPLQLQWTVIEAFKS